MVGSRSGLMSEVELLTGGRQERHLEIGRKLKQEFVAAWGLYPLHLSPAQRFPFQRLGVRSGARDQCIGRGRRPVAGADELHHRGARVLHVGRSFHQTGLVVYCILNK
ncbi:unnamed protein product [Musa hybrid cultivar]